MSLLQLYLIFLKIGIFTFGGGYAMIPLFYDELVLRHNLLSSAEFANLIALAQITPGPVGLNAATYIGYQQGGFWGALSGTLGVTTPSLTLGMAIACCVGVFRNSALVKAALSGIRPATLGMIAAAVIFFANTSLFTAPVNHLWTSGAQFGLCWQAVLIFALTLLFELRWHLNMVWLLLGSALLSWVLFQF
ncbi:MAG: chromate transporter [Oligosphaeraceae bacterium]|nr:chromate transporter [Oligosphaeraceae bacterium]